MLSLRVARHTIGSLNSASSSLSQRVGPISYLLAKPQSCNQIDLPIRSHATNGFSLTAVRGLATEAPAAKPKAHTGRATTRKATTTKATHKTTAGTKNAPAKKTKPAKKKAKTKAKKKATKPKVKKPKKVLTPEEKKKIRIRELKIQALAAPHNLPDTAWNVVMAEVVKTSEGLVNGVKEASAKYRNLLPEEREHYNHIANQSKQKNDAAYKAWIESFTPLQIRTANNARTQLRRLTGHSRKWTVLKDDRQVKRPATSRLLFNKDRWASGDLKGMGIKEVSEMLNTEWTNLPAQEKKVYEDAYAQDKARYAQEKTRVYGEIRRSTRKPRAKKDSTAASAQSQREAASA